MSVSMSPHTEAAIADFLRLQQKVNGIDRLTLFPFDAMVSATPMNIRVQNAATVSAGEAGGRGSMPAMSRNVRVRPGDGTGCGRFECADGKDSVRGRGPETFRFRTGPFGTEYTISLLREVSGPLSTD